MNECHDQPSREQLPVYVSMRRQAASAAPPRDLDRHLVTCAACREEINQLEVLMSELDHPELLPAAPAGVPDLAFLAPQPRPARPAFGDLLLRITAEFMAELRRPTLAGAMRGEAVLRYRYEPEDPTLPALAVEIDRDPHNPALGIVRVTVGDPFFPARAGCRISLVVGGKPRLMVADDHGHATFDAIALADLPAIELHVSPAA